MIKKIFVSIVFFFVLAPSVQAATLSDINSLINGSVTYSGAESNLVITQTTAGVYEVKAKIFPCLPGGTCEPDRYQVDFGRNIPHIYGLGMVASSNQVELSDFLDTSFGSGHLDSPTDRFEGDVGRMRTPLFIVPSENLIIAYIQPTVKMLRLTRTASSTSMVLKKHNIYNEGAPAPLLIIKGSNPTDMYQKYYQYLKTHGFSFRKPNYKIFGVGWETFDEFGCSANFPEVTAATDRFIQASIPLSFSIIGSGYWNNDTGEGGCGTPGLPTTDTLTQHQSRYGQYGGLNLLISNLRAKGIALGLGMRLNVQTGNVNFIQNQFASRGILTNVFLDNNIYYGNSPSNNARILNVNSPTVLNTFIDLTRSGYGQYAGIKEDEMFYADQFHLRDIPNFADGMISKSYPQYYQKIGNDFFIIGRNDWFSVQSDANSGQGWVDVGISNWSGYQNLKPLIDSALTQIVSGYPHPMIEPTINVASDWHNDSAKDLPASKNKEYLRMRALQSFMPVTTYSRGFWHVTDQTYQNSVIFYAKLRSRLHQYAFDQSQKWFETGVPQLLQPLFIRFSDSEIPTLYSKANTPNDARNEYMFGNALLVRPLFSNSDTFPVYLPTGKWKPFMVAGPEITGGRYINYTIAQPNDFPVFLKEGELLVIADATNLSNMQAFVYFNGSTSTPEYSYYRSDGTKYRLQGQINSGVVTVKNLDTGISVATTPDPYGKGFQVANINTLVAKPGDINADGIINTVDLKLVISSWLGSNYDQNLDNKANAFDAAKVLLNFGR